MSGRLRGVVCFVGVGLLIGVAWWYFYVKPHDEFRKVVGSCMTERDDYSMESYETCINQELALKKQRECMDLFQEIAEVQEARGLFMADFEPYIQGRQAGKIGKQKFAVARTTWLQKENQLATEANKLYEKAFEEDCFNEDLGRGEYESR